MGRQRGAKHSGSQEDDARGPSWLVAEEALEEARNLRALLATRLVQSPPFLSLFAFPALLCPAQLSALLLWLVLPPTGEAQLAGKKEGYGYTKLAHTHA